MSRETMRLKLQELLESTPGISKVYFQPPASLSIKYPCIVYNYEHESGMFADDKMYIRHDRYALTLITKESMPEDKMEFLKSIPYCRFSRHYVSDNLHHFAYDVTLSERT